MRHLVFCFVAFSLTARIATAAVAIDEVSADWQNVFGAGATLEVIDHGWFSGK